MPSIVTITMNPAVDKSTTVDKVFPEHKLRCTAMITEAGGGGINVTKALNKLGGDSLAVFPSGGINGKILESYLSSKHISFQTIPLDVETRENFVVSETVSHTQFRFVLPGPVLSQKEADACVDLLLNIRPRPEIVVASGSLPPGLTEDFYARLASVVRQMGAKYIVDSSGRPLQLAVQEGVYLLKPNLGELASLAGKSKLQLHEVEEAAADIIRRGQATLVVVSLGASGALLVTKEHRERIPAPTIKKLSTVGAGDSMVAGMAWMMIQGKSQREMARFGVACGSAATMNSGTQLFHTEDVYTLYNWINAHSPH